MLMECQPCHEQDRNSSAEFWCTECEEALCDSCKSQHKSFKVSKNHKVSKLSSLSVKKSSSDKQKEDIGGENGEWVMCTEHDDKSLEYFCIKHEKPCCILCKRKYHRHCCEVEKVEDVIDDTKLASITEDFLSGIEEHKNRLTKVANNERCNLRDLEIIKDTCTADLKNTRIAIEEHLDILQNDVEQKMNQRFEGDSGEINKHLTDLSAKFNYYTDQQKLIRDIAKESTMSIGQKYLRILRLEHLKSSYNESNETLSKCNLRAITNYKLSYDKTSDSITICINRTLQEKNNDMGNFQGNKDEIESSSSIVELEATNSEAKYLPLSVPVRDSPLTFPVTSAPSLTAKRRGVSPIGPIHDSSITYCLPTALPTNVSCPSPSAEGSPSEFHLKKSFFIEKRNKNAFITDAKLMPNKYNIAMAEKSNRKCMMYSKDGQKKGQVQLSGEPDSIAVMQSNRIGVTLVHEKKVCVIDTDSWQFIFTIHVHDDCKGLVYFENKLIANCANDGLMHIDCYGKIVKQNNNIKGDLYCHLDNQGNLYTAKMKAKNIHVHNLINNKRSTYYIKGPDDLTGLTTDRNNNLFVACNDNDTIVVKQSLHSPAKVILENSDGIDHPMSIDYDQQNDELLVVNNAGHSIFIFKRQ
ncbi:tripartite motif-containing protein 55-like [Mytilus californianus]|uniref:tripartite motif-containing protein 55-like n=1 Tax=Mytilus californianus TaxID=6549 RepID=UPI002245D29A|nr:tripartite motif-containing protein 55-like [Mytilus californianus]